VPQTEAIMKITVLGAGALGGYFGGWLAENGADVTFLVRPKRQALLAANGLVIESPVGPLKRPVKTATVGTVEPDADIVLLTCKAYDLDDAIASIRPAMGPNTAVLPILNGMAHIDRLVADFGATNVIGGLCKIQATLGPDGRILHMNDWNEIVFGELDGTMSPRVRALEALFPKPQTKPKAVANIREELWKKLVHLGTVATVTTLTREALGPVQATRDGPWLVESTLRAVRRIAEAEGVAISEDYVQAYLKLFREAGVTYKASMLRDMEKGGATEGEHIVGYLRDRAAAHGIDAPIFRIAAANVQTYEHQRRAPNV
jgi:2-dehydropantoate 2-reductase